MNQIKPIKNWSRVMIDTSVIVDYTKNPARFDKNPGEKDRIEKVQQLINYLTNTPHLQEPPMLLVSAISIAELSKLPESRSNIERVTNLFSGTDVVFVDFTASIAASIPLLLDGVLPDGQKFQWLKQLEQDLRSEGISWARQWVSDDLKIIASAHAQRRKLDALISSDTKVFAQLATKLDLPLVQPDKIPTYPSGAINVDVAFNGV
jgi:hypothetical protein